MMSLSDWLDQTGFWQKPMYARNTLSSDFIIYFEIIIGLHMV